MTNRSEIEVAAAKFYEIRNRADLEAAQELFHPDIRFCIVGTRQLGAFTSPLDGIDAVRTVAVQLFETWDLRGLDNVSVHVDGDTIFVHRKGAVRFIPTDTLFDTEIMDKIEFKDGLIFDYMQFTDTYLVAQIAGLPPGQSL